MDTALLDVRYVSPDKEVVPYAPIEVLTQSDECYKCPLLSAATIAHNSNATIPVQTNFPTSLRIVQSGKEVCNLRYQFLESAEYKFVVSMSDENTTTCSEMQEMTYDHNAYLPILFAFLVFLGAAIIWIVGKWVVRKYHDSLKHFFSYQRLVHSDLGNPATITNTSVEQAGQAPRPENKPANAAGKQRLRSLDTLRGLSLTLMIFVNYGGGGYWFFNHSAWDGLTVADLLFPWFVWIMGVAIAFAYRGPLQRGESRFFMFLKVVRRTAILFVFGLIINTNNCSAVPLSELRIMGVLQRLAISYFFVATLEIVFGKFAMTIPQSNPGSFGRSFVIFFWDLFGSAPQWLFIFALVAIHTCITFLLPVPGCPTGYLGPGGIADEGQFYNCTGGAAQLVDRVILGESHMYGTPTCQGTYHTIVPYDPEGLLGCLTSIVMCYLGLHAGRVLTLYPTAMGRLGRWLNWAVIWGLIAGILCGFSQHGGVIPVNKNLWSLSFILSLSSMGLVLLSALYVACDVAQVWSGAPFIYPGMNSIVVYMLHEILHTTFPVSFAVNQTHPQQLAMNLWGVSLWTIVAAVMYYYNVFIAI